MAHTRLRTAVALFLLLNVVSGQSVCTFDQGMCGWTNAKSNDVDWKRNQGSTPSLGTGPSVDHTNGTAYGYYIYFETSGLQSQAISTLASPVLNPAQSSSCQISIAYHMSGNQVGTLEVLLHPQYSERLLWSRQGDQGNKWNVANITIGSVRQSFQVYVRATHVQCFSSSCYHGDIALDDLKFTGCSFAPQGVTLAPPTLPPPLKWPNQNCTFEQDMCQWDNVFTNRVDWIRRQGYTPSYGTGPSDDYTFRNGSGHYVYVETSSLPSHSSVVFESSYQSSGALCELKFAYHFYGQDIGNLDVYLQASSGARTLLWNKNGNQGNVWHMARVLIGLQSSQFKIVFNATHLGGIQGDMALDDLLFFNCDPNLKLKPCTSKQFKCRTSGFCIDLDRLCDLTKDCFDGSDETLCINDQCDFEASMCDFTNDEKNDNFDWISARGGTVSYSTGPTADHSTGNATGRYIYIESSAPRQPGDIANLISPIYPKYSSSDCHVRFYTYMYGQHIGSLLVLFRPVGKSPQLLQNITGDQGQEWRRVSVSVPTSASQFNLIFVGVRGNGYAGDIAIDDFSLSPNCPNALKPSSPAPVTTANCDFEQGMCAWQNEYLNDLNWARNQGQGSSFYYTGISNDHTIGNSSGYFLTVDSPLTASVYGTTSRLYSPVMAIDNANCKIVFYYILRGYFAGNLTLSMTTDQGKTLQWLWEKSGDQGNQWQRVSVSVTRVPTNFQLVFETSQVTPYYFWRSSDIAIDDIMFEPCTPRTCTSVEKQCANKQCYRSNWECNGLDDCDDGSDELGCANECDFEQGMCGWKNVQSDTADWTRSSGSTLTDQTGPSYDHTSYSSSGFYVYLETSGLKAGSSAILQSKQYDHFGHTCAFSFAYIMNGQDVGTLAVDVVTNAGTRISLWSRSGNKGSAWFTTTLHLGASPTGFVIQIIATHGGGNLGDIAIDDLELTNCVKTPTVATPTAASADFPLDSSCDFETNLCSWTNSPDDEVDWVPHSGGTSSYGTGPTNDHTYGTPSGYYLYVETSGLYSGAWAVLESDVYQRAGQMCQLKFAYNMNGYSIGTLEVILKDLGHQTNKTVWTQSGNHGDNWLTGTVRLSKQKNRFQILFKMTHGSGYGGDIALDDVAFSGCDPSFKPPKCTKNQFRCANKWCVDLSQVCDFTDDCGDASDEVGCSASSLHCNFDSNSKCGFQNANDDDFEWVASRGSAYRYSSGPNSDHSTGTSQGYYVYTDSDYTNRPGDAARFSSSVYSGASSGCWFVFYYYFTQYSSGHLNVYIKTNNVLGSPILSINSTKSASQLWNRFQYQITTSSQYQIVFEAVHGSFYYYSTVSIDDISLSSQCGKAVSTAISPALTPPNCDFESQGFCDWKNYFFNDRDWTITQGGSYSYYSLPPMDHTLGSSGNTSGHFAYVRGSYYYYFNYGVRSSELTSPVMNNQNWNCYIVFYYLLSNSPGNLTLNQHSVDKITGGITGTTQLYKISGNQGNSWQRARVKVKTVNGNFILMFHGDTTNYYGSTIAIDDIRFEACNPPASCSPDEFRCRNGYCIPSTWNCSKVDDCGDSSDEMGCANECDFEQDLCTWSNVYSDDTDFRRYAGPTPSTNTGPSVDHTFGTTAGYYIYIEASYVSNGARAYLESPTYAYGTFCYVKFAYNMYGGGNGEMGTLEVQIISSTGDHVVWSKSGDQGGQWNDATVAIATRGSYKIRFVASRGTGYHSDVALDDIALLPCTGPMPTLAPTTPPPPKEFPSGSCDFESKSNSMCDWRNAQYDSIDWQLRVGRTPSYNTGPTSDHTLGTALGHYIYVETSGVPGGSYAALESPLFKRSGFDCQMSFAYSMYGSGIGSLYVYVVPDGGQPPVEVWSRTGNQGSGWHLGKIYLGTRTSYRLAFNATHGSGFTGDIALDDIVFTRCDPAIIPKACNSSEFTCANKRCVAKEYQCDLADNCGDNSDESSSACKGYGVCNFEVNDCGYVNEQISDAFDWTPGKGQTLSVGTGPPADHTYGTPNGHYMYIETSYPRVLGEKAILQSPEFNKAPRKSHCRLRFYYSMNGASVGSLAVVLRYTKGNFQTTLMNVTGNQGNSWLRASFSIATSQNFRIQFIASRGSSYTSDIAIDDITWTSNCPSQVPVPSVPAVAKAPCSFEDGKFCSWTNDFFNDVNWQIQQGSTASFTTGPSADHTYDNTTGHYAYVEASYSQRGESARLLSPMLEAYSPSRKYCYVVFYYHMFGSDVGSLNVYSKPNQGNKNLWSKTGDQGDVWQRAQLLLPTLTKQYQIVFDVVQGSGFRGDIAIDDIRFLECTPPVQCNAGEFQCNIGYCVPSQWQCNEFDDCEDGSDEWNCTKLCTFERSSNLCGVWNVSDAGDLTWSRQSRSSSPFSTGPNVDHTIGARQGHYLISTVSASRPGQRAILTTVSRATYTWCKVHFAYYVTGSDVGTLEVMLKTDQGSDIQLWSRSGDQGSQWNQASVNLPQTNGNAYAVRFVFTSTGGYRGYVALDDVALDECAMRPSLVPPTTPAIQLAFPAGTCGFESSMCHYYNLKSNGVDWVRRAGATPSFNTGPTVDHTTGKTSGHYVYIESSGLPANSTAMLESPVYRSTGKMCGMRFAYHLYGSDIGKLEVIVQDLKLHQSTQVWMRSGNQGNGWHHALVPIGALSSNHQFAFKATHANGFRGDMAIDDVSFSLCDPGYQYPTCSALQYACTSGQCVSDDFVCDNDFDCNDKSDESSAACTTFQEAYSCDFNTSMCGFVSDPTANFTWISGHGQTVSYGTGPGFDHTSDSEYGRYMYMEASYPRVQGENALLISPVFKPAVTSSCSVRLFYHMHGQHIGSLTVFMRSADAKYSSFGKWKQVWTQSGTQGNIWNRLVLTPISGYYQVGIQGTIGNGFSGDIAIDDFSLTKGCGGEVKRTPPSAQLPSLCTFEKGMCGYQNVFLNDIDWSSHAGFTASSGTGPNFDHTFQNSTGHYVYMETSTGELGHNATLVSPLYKQDGSKCMTFFYNMYGSDVGNLSVYTLDQRGRKVRGFNLAGNQGSFWKRGIVSLTSLSGNYRVVFEGLRGSGFRGDIAIDDISFGSCSTVAPVTVSPCGREQFSCHDRSGCVPLTDVCDFVTACADGSDEATCTMKKCDFESNLCNWNVDDSDFTWKRYSGNSGQSNGPSSDHYNKNGYYLLAVESGALKSTKAVLRSSPFTQSGTNCRLLFWYYMSGTVGSLKVQVRVGQTRTVIWQMKGDQGSTWKQIYANVGRQANFVIEVEADLPSPKSGSGSVAVDDLQLTNCEQGAVFVCTPEEFTCLNTACVKKWRVCDYHDDCGDGSDEDQATCKSFYANCDFESSCSWTTTHKNKFKWQLKSAETSGVDVTGPGYDSNGKSSGHYMIASGTLATRANQAIQYVSPWLSATTTNPGCYFRFSYFIAGNNPGTLKVYYKSGSTNVVLWSVSAQTNGQWIRKEILLNVLNNYQLYIESMSGLNRGSAFMAIDDVSFSLLCPRARPVVKPSSGTVVTIPTTAPGGVTKGPTLTPNPCGRPGFFTCASDLNKCLPPSYKCDGFSDCADKSDELNCRLNSLDCDFDDPALLLCHWTVDKTVSNTWTVRSGATDYGPNQDHTSESSAGYLLSQYSSFVRTSKSPLVARLVSIQFPYANEGCQMSFFYFIRSPYANFATLTISTTDSSGSGHNPKTFTGSSNAKWTKGIYSLKSALAFNVTIESTITAKESTVSIDDIYFQGNCPDPLKSASNGGGGGGKNVVWIVVGVIAGLLIVCGTIIFLYFVSRNAKRRKGKFEVEYHRHDDDDEEDEDGDMRDETQGISINADRSRGGALQFVNEYPQRDEGDSDEELLS